MKARILIAEDDPAILKLLETNLQVAGYEVVCAEDGAQALDAARAQVFDLALLDIMMPGMNGIEVCQRLKSSPSTQNIKIIAISGDQGPSLRERVLNAGADLFFAKPLDVVAFRQQCFNLLQS